MAKKIMIQGTMSGVGKSLITAGLCRIFAQDGYKTAPFKSQNMALNSYVTEDGCEIGRAQAMQAEAAGCKPVAELNPILLKPNTDTGSQVIVMGKAIGDMSAMEYYSRKRELIPYIMDSYKKLEEEYDIIVIEGAGSPAEVNLKDNDIVNMGLAAMVDAPVLIVGDIDRGGVFAQLLGTLDLLTEDERGRVKGLVINKFRGDPSLLDSGLRILEDRGGIPVTGLIPYMDVRLEDEDSLSDRLKTSAAPYDNGDIIDIAVIRFVRMSNFTDMDIFEGFSDVRVRYVSALKDMGNPDMVILPGSKNTIEDLKWLHETGLADKVHMLAVEGRVVFGICGGMQMLGKFVYEDEKCLCSESAEGRYEGLGLLPVYTVMGYDKTLKQTDTVIGKTKGALMCLTGHKVTGYEIHEGRTYRMDNVSDPYGAEAKTMLTDAIICSDHTDCMNVYGTYIHGIFDEGGTAKAVVEALAENKGTAISDITYMSGVSGYRDYKETQYDKLADILRKSLDMDAIYGMLG